MTSPHYNSLKPSRMKDLIKHSMKNLRVYLMSGWMIIIKIKRQTVQGKDEHILKDIMKKATSSCGMISLVKRQSIQMLYFDIGLE